MTPVRSRLIAASVLVAGLAAGATGVALADNTPNATTSPTPSASPSAGEKGDGTRPGKPKGHGTGGRHGPGMFGARAPLHGEFVVPQADGGFQTMVVQRGEVTAVSKTEITVRSDDDFTTTYAVTAATLVNAARDGITSIKKGATVNIVATKAGDKATAIRIGDHSAREGIKERLGLDGPPADV
jgi:hypothetical protein